MTVPGRNDPCWCGSGKKYKKCHWSQDQADAVVRGEKEKARRARLEALGAPGEAEMREMFTRLTNRDAPNGPLPNDAREAIIELWRQERLTAEAEARMAEERDAMRSYFAEHDDEFERIGRAVANDRYFNQYELTNQNRNKVRAALGPWPSDEAERRQYATEAATLSLDAEDRQLFYDGLRAFLSDLVDEGKMKEAHVVAIAAERALDPAAPLTPFLEDVVRRSLSPIK